MTISSNGTPKIATFINKTFDDTFGSTPWEFVKRMTFVASHAVVTALLLTLGILIPSMLFSGAGIFARWIRRSIDAADVSVAEAWLQVTAITDLRTWVIMWMSMLVVMGLIVLSARLLRNGFINAIFMGHMLRQGLPALAMAPSALARAAKTLGHDRH